MVDLPQHAGHVVAARELLLGNSKWPALLYINYYTPYLLPYGLALLLSFFVPVVVAFKAILTLAFWGFVASCILLRRRFDGDRRLDWLFIPGFFGYAYGWGFYTFMVAAPLGMLFILLAHHYAESPNPRSALFLFFASLALFFSHGLTFLFVNAIGALFLVLRYQQPLRLVRDALPYVGIGLWCTVYGLVRLNLEDGPVSTLLKVEWGFGDRLDFLLYSMSSPRGELDADWRFAPLLLGMLAAPFVLGARLQRRRPSALLSLVVVLAVGVFMPLTAWGTWSLYPRFAIFLLPFYALAFRAPAGASQGVLKLLWLPAACWIILAVHAERLMAFARESADFETVLAAAAPGHRALGLILDPSSPAAASTFAYVHFPLWYQAEANGLVDFSFSGYDSAVVRYRRSAQPAIFSRSGWAYRPAQVFNWSRDQPEIYRYFFVRNSAPLPAGYFPAGRCAPGLVASAGAWSLYENVNCHVGS